MSEALELFWAFARAGLLGFGGGPAMIPMIQVEVVELRGWLTPAEFLDAFAFGNALPGPIATKLAGFVGFQVAGWGGAAAALAGMTLPTIAVMLALASLYQRFKGHAAVQSFLYGVRPVVVALLALVVWDFLPAAMAPDGLRWGSWPLWLLAATALWASLKTRLHPAFLIVLGGAAGWLV